MSPRTIALAALGVGSAIGFLVGRPAGVLAYVLKALPVLCMLVAVLPRGGLLPRAVAVGLGLSVVGDVVLEMPGDSLFIAGLVAFLCAHVAYVVGFVADSRAPRASWALPFAAWVGAAYAVLYPGLGALALPVAVYVLVIGTMMWRAAARLDGGVTPGRLAGLAGAVTFGASDTILAFNRFYEPMEWAGLAIMVTYWLGQLGITVAAARE